MVSKLSARHKLTQILFLCTRRNNYIGSKCPGISGTVPDLAAFVPGPGRPFNLSIVCPGVTEIWGPHENGDPLVKMGTP